jgi:hypothetical protein
VKGIQEELKMTKSFVLIGFALVAITGSACSVAVRDADHYRDDVNKVLETKNGDVKACYDGLLQSKKDLAGNVTVHFTVEHKTGVFKDITTDGPPELGTCVSNALNGLVLAPPDDGHTGDATFVYAFTVGAPAAS